MNPMTIPLVIFSAAPSLRIHGRVFGATWKFLMDLAGKCNSNVVVRVPMLVHVTSTYFSAVALRG